MSSSFRIKNGDLEIEFEGSAEEVSLKFKETFDWLKTATIPQSGKKKEEKSANNSPVHEKQTKVDGRGGVRSPVVSQAIADLMTGSFFQTQKTAEQTFDELTRLNISVANVHTVEMALNRRVPKTMDRVKNTEGKWVYRKKA